MASKYNLRIFPMAQADMEQIFRYIAEELCNPSAAIGQINDFEAAFQRLCAFPESYPYTCNEYVKDKTLRKMVVNRYLVFYRIKGDQVQVIRGLYGMRNYADFL